MKKKLTKTLCEKATYSGRGGDHKIYIMDATEEGFGLRLRSSSKAFIFRYRVQGSGRRREITIGPFGPLTVQQARQKAKALRVMLVQGIDPAEQKQRVAKLTLADWAPSYVEYVRDVRKKKTWRDDQRRLEQHVCPLIGACALEEIKAADIMRVKAALSEKPYEGNMVLALLKAMFNRAPKLGALPEGHPNPVTGIERYPERRRERFVTAKEMPAVAESINQERNPYIRGALWLYLLTGMRRSELLRAKWSDVDLERKTLRLPQTKAGRPHTVRLSDAAVKILKDLPRMLHNPHIIPGRKKGEALVNINKPWGRVRQRAGIEDVRLHDLRRTLGSWMAQGGDSLITIGKALGHSNTSTTATYAHLLEDPVHEAVNAAAQAITSAGSKNGS